MCKRCGRKFTDEHWQEITVHRTAVRARDKSVCGQCHADDVARQEAAAEAARLEAAAPPAPEDDPEPGGAAAGSAGDPDPACHGPRGISVLRGPARAPGSRA